MDMPFRLKLESCLPSDSVAAILSFSNLLPFLLPSYTPGLHHDPAASRGGTADLLLGYISSTTDVAVWLVHGGIC